MHARLAQLRDDFQARVNEQQSMYMAAVCGNDWSEAAKLKASKEMAIECNRELLVALMDIEAAGVDIAACIDAALAAITARLKAKGAMFEPDEEWCRLQECAGALAKAKEVLK